MYRLANVVAVQTDPRAANCRAFAVDSAGMVVGVYLEVVYIPSSRYELVRAELIDEAHAGGNTVATCTVLDKNGIQTGESDDVGLGQYLTTRARDVDDQRLALLLQGGSCRVRSGDGDRTRIGIPDTQCVRTREDEQSLSAIAGDHGDHRHLTNLLFSCRGVLFGRTRHQSDKHASISECG